MIFSRRCQMLFAGAALGISVLLTDCERKDEPPPPQVAQVIDRMVQESLSDYAEDEEIIDLIADYKQSGNPAIATQDGTTMLHLACTAGNLPLIQHLLQQGADPNAESEIFGLPMVCLFDTPRDKAAETRLMMNLLLSHGAKLKNYSVFRFSENLDENTYIYLLNQSWEGEQGRQAGVVPALRGWSVAFRMVLDKAGKSLPDDCKTLLHELAAGDRFGTEGHYLDCAQLLLARGASVEQEDAFGTTPIMTAAKAAFFALAEGSFESRPSDMLQLLLQNNANVYRTFDNDPDYPGYCAYDLLMGHKQLMANLEVLGYSFDTPPPLDFTEGKGLLHTVLRADLRSESVESLRSAFGQIATLLSPDAAMKHAPDYPEALCSAVNLLMRADEVQGTATIAAMPLWMDEQFWLSDSEVPLMVLQTIHNNTVALDPEILLPLAQKAESAGRHRVAAELMELLAFSTVDDGVLESYTTDSRTALQAGAWQAVLLRRGIPAAKMGHIEDWLWVHNRQTATTAAMKRALRLTSHNRIWTGNMDQATQELLFADIAAVGEPEIAEKYSKAAAEIDSTGNVDDEEDWEALFFRLECATARFLLQHADLFEEQEAQDPAKSEEN